MAFHALGRFGPVYQTCRYGGSRLAFRGPRRDLRSDYIAFIGGTETYGKFVETPFPQLVETETGLTCVNLGWPNAGIDVLLGDPGLARIAAGAQIAVVQVPCAVNLSNRFYRVHARRNDRFLQATGLLRRLYPEVDFTEFSFTRHMLLRLRATSPERFALVHAELSAVWTEGMKRLIGEIGRPVVLLWFSGRRPEWQCDNPDMAHEPALVSRGMLDALKRRAAALVEVDSGAGGHAADDRGLVVSRQDRQAARELPGQPAHEVAAQALVPVIAELLDP